MFDSPKCTHGCILYQKVTRTLLAGIGEEIGQFYYWTLAIQGRFDSNSLLSPGQFKGLVV